METTKCVKELDIEIDNPVPCNQHISKLRSKAAMQNSWETRKKWQ